MRNQKVLGEIMGLSVEVYSTSGSASFTDRGVIELFDDDFIRLKKDNGEVLYMNLRQIRIIKPRPQ